MARRKSSTPKLTERESEIMSHLWERGPLFVRELLESYDDPKPHFNTISTIVRILEEKGYVGHEQVGSSHRYYAAVAPSYFAERSLAQVITNFFNNSPMAAVSALVEEEKLSVDDLRQIIEMVEQRNKKTD